MMDCHQNKATQEYAVKLASEDDNVRFWIQPGYYKFSWENCAKVIVNKDDNALSSYLTEILEWLQDINWPGALAVLYRLKKMNPSILKTPLEKTVLRAYSDLDKNSAWLENLSEFYEINELMFTLEPQIRNILKYEYCKLNS